MNVPVVAAALLLSFWLPYEDSPSDEDPRIDLRGAAFLAMLLITLTFLLSSLRTELSAPSNDGEWGLGQMPDGATSLVSVRGVCYPGNTEYRANFLLHEFVHAMQNLGWATTDPEVEGEIWAAYANAVQRGQFDAPRNEPLEGITPFDAFGDDEYLTHNINAWFDLNESLPGPWVDVQIGDSGPPSGTRAELRARDPQLYEIIGRFLPDTLGGLMEGCSAPARSRSRDPLRYPG